MSSQNPLVTRTTLTDPSRGLSAAEIRISFLRSAGLSAEGIARVMGTSAMAISAVLGRPQVQRYLLALNATHTDDIRDIAAGVNKAILTNTQKAVEVVTTTMTDMFDQRQDVSRAKLAFACAQDILDRAGATAPKKVDIHGEVEHSLVDSEALGQIADVLKELGSMSKE